MTDRLEDPMSDQKATRLLVVDDEPYIREVLSRWLSAYGYECDTASGADEALGSLAKVSYPLVLSDVNMPGKTGIEFLQELKERHGDEVAVIMVTGQSDRKIAIRSLELGAYDYVIKPVDETELSIRVANALQRRQLKLQSKNLQQLLEQKVRERTAQVRRREEEIAWRLIWAADSRDHTTGSHIRRIGLYAKAVAQRLGWDQRNLDDIKLAAAMHDVGKIAVPDAILLKPGPLTEQEFEVVKGHAQAGADILHGSATPLLQLAEEIALCHHEWWDGSGYPRGLVGEKIPESARIVATVDIFDALTHDRPYRDALAEEAAISIMARQRGTHLDPRIFDVFLELLPEIRRIGELGRHDSASTRLQDAA